VLNKVAIESVQARPTTRPPVKWAALEWEPNLSSVVEGMIAAQAAQIAAARRWGVSFLMAVM
jgi:hypothetical protein